MTEILWDRLIAVVLSAFILSLAIGPLIKKLAWRYQWFDKPDHRKIHQYPTPRIGGIAIFVSFAVISFVTSYNSLVSPVALTFGRFMIFLVGSLLIFLLGVFDDLRGMDAYRKFSVQVVAGLLAYLAGFHLTTLHLPFIGPVDVGLAGIPLTLLWIAGVTNAMNLIDGMNGLAGGVSAISAFFIGLVAMYNGHYETAYLSWILMASIIGFLPYNLRDGRIFMGDSGSLFIGYALSLLSISAAYRSDTVPIGPRVFLLIPVVILGLPIMDTLMAIIRRAFRGRGLFSGDLGHIHHRLLSRLLCPKKTVLVLYAVSGILGFLALLITYEVRYVTTAISVMVIVTTVVGVAHYGNVELQEFFQKRFDMGRRRRTPWYKNKMVHKISQRISSTKSIKYLYRHLALACRELEADLISLEVTVMREDGRSGVIRYEWPLRKPCPNGDSLWVTRYPLMLDGQFYGNLVYKKTKWKRRRISEEDEIWVMAIGKSVHEWLVVAVRDEKIDLGDLDFDAVTPEFVTASR